LEFIANGGFEKGLKRVVWVLQWMFPRKAVGDRADTKGKTRGWVGTVRRKTSMERDRGRRERERGGRMRGICKNRKEMGGDDVGFKPGTLSNQV